MHAISFYIDGKVCVQHMIKRLMGCTFDRDTYEGNAYVAKKLRGDSLFVFLPLSFGLRAIVTLTHF